MQTSGQNKTKKNNPSYISALSFGSRSEFQSLESHQTASSLHGKMRPKMELSHSLGGKRTGGNSGGDSQRQGSENAVQLLALFVFTQRRCFAKWRRVFPPMA